MKVPFQTSRGKMGNEVARTGQPFGKTKVGPYIIPICK